MRKENIEKLIGFVGSVIDLSCKLVALGCEDICDFGNIADLIKDGDMVVATDETGEQHIQIFFNIVHEAGEDEIYEATIIKITNVEDF